MGVSKDLGSSEGQHAPWVLQPATRYWASRTSAHHCQTQKQLATRSFILMPESPRAKHGAITPATSQASPPQCIMQSRFPIPINIGTPTMDLFVFRAAVLWTQDGMTDGAKVGTLCQPQEPLSSAGTPLTNTIQIPWAVGLVHCLDSAACR